MELDTINLRKKSLNEVISILKLEFDDELIDQFASKVADRAAELLKEKFESHKLPYMMTREEAMNFLRCGPTKMAELIARPDFPVNREIGLKIPYPMLIKWIEKNTTWVENNK